MTLGKLLKLSMPQGPHLETEDDDMANLEVCCEVARSLWKTEYLLIQDWDWLNPNLDALPSPFVV